MWMSSPIAEPAERFRAVVPPGLGGKDILRRQRLMAQWRRHSRLIRALRALLPLLCVGLLLVLGGWALLNTLYWRVGAAAQNGALVVRMLKPNFQGRDEKGEPYRISAASALRDDKDTAVITMESPVFTLGSGGLDETKVTARRGVYREDTRILNLTGDVHLDDGQGYHFVTEHALIDTKTNNVDGEQHVDGFGPLGRIAASSYAIRQGGAHVYFAGRVKTRAYDRSTPTGAASAATSR
jgi:lipopolysaccharide export system protein LptC